VAVLAPAQPLGPELAPPRRWRALGALREAGARILVGATVRRTAPGGLELTTGEDAPAEHLPCDAVVWADGLEADGAFAEALAREGVAVRRIGDAVAPRLLDAALRDAFELAAAPDPLGEAASGAFGPELAE
jgi:NADH dehydrogenase FAD-containing subunit